MSDIEIDITSPTLFGNEVAEDETEDVFNSYWVSRPEEEHLQNPENRIAIILAYKGEGKSGLLRVIGQKIERQKSTLVIRTTGQDAAPSLNSVESTEWSRAWKNSFLNLIASEVGSLIDAAWNDDDISLVELAEKNGFRRKSLISTILNRLSFSGAELKKTLSTPSNTEKTLSRTLDDDTKIWLFIDDTDKNYLGTKEWTARLCGLLDALRDITKAVPQLIVRASLRPNVWAIISGSYESLSHVRQYLVQLPWTEKDALNMISRRIEGYLARTGQVESFNQSCTARVGSNAWREVLLQLVFDSPVAWGGAGKTRSIYIPVSTLANHRPRWMIELLKLAAKYSKANSAKRIKLGHLNAVMAVFGQHRKTDTVAEFGAQCTNIDEFIDAFHQQNEEFTTDEFLTLIDNRILNHLTPIIPGVLGTARNRDVASVLFEIGFIYGRRDNPDGSYNHVSYADSPSLFRSRTNMDSGLRWEIHPIFRQSLEIRDSSGKITQGPKKKRSRKRNFSRR